MEAIENKQLTDKPGWVRVSLHPVMTDAEVIFITQAIKEIVENQKEWASEYSYNPASNEFDSPKQGDSRLKENMKAIYNFL